MRFPSQQEQWGGGMESSTGLPDELRPSVSVKSQSKGVILQRS